MREPFKQTDIRLKIGLLLNAAALVMRQVLPPGNSFACFCMGACTALAIVLLLCGLVRTRRHMRISR